MNITIEQYIELLVFCLCGAVVFAAIVSFISLTLQNDQDG